MPKAFSIYLDLVRFLAAMAVFLAHLGSSPFNDGVIWSRLTVYGDVAVTVFFVLSGYVIAHVISTRERTFREYAASRVARLYSVVLVALLLTYLLDSAGMQLNPQFYRIEKVLMKPVSWSGYASSLIFVNEFQIFGFGGIAPGTNNPFWSLSFEASYYAVAGLVIFAPKRISIPAAALLLALGGRTIFALMPLWFLGFFLYLKRDSVKVSMASAVLLLILSIATLAFLPTFIKYLPQDNWGRWFPWGRQPFNRNLLEDYLAATAFGLNMIAMHRISLSNTFSFNWSGHAIRWLGSLTFPLYCIHYPVICFFAAISPWSPATPVHVAFVACAVLAVVAGLTPLCEGLKKTIHGWLSPMPARLPRPG